MTHRLGLITLAMALGCADTARVTRGGNDTGPVVTAPDKSIFIRASFDDDPTSYGGGMLDDLPPAQIDETRGAQTRCSALVKSRVVNASGSFEHTFNASSGASGSLGITPYGKASASQSEKAGLLVKYSLKKKMIFEIPAENRDKFFQCCDQAPEHCKTLMIGEFLAGDGEVSQYAGADNDVSASGEYKIAAADFSFKDGAAWKRVTTFQNVYFAFRTRATGTGSASAGPCGADWTSSVPSSLDGKYFVGVSPRTGTESQARDHAMLNARKQAVRYLGQELSEKYSETSAAVAGLFEDETLVTAASKGVASLVKDRCWAKVDSEQHSDGMGYIARVLAFFPESAKKEAQVAATAAIAEAAKGGPPDKAKAAAELRGKVAR